MKKLNTSVFLSDHINKKGLSKLYIQVIIDRKTRRYPLQIFIEPENWDQLSSKIIKRNDKNDLNRIITNEIAKINKHYFKMLEMEDVSFEKLDELYLKIDNTKISDIVKLHCKGISKSSYKFYLTAEAEITRLFGDISINKIDYKKVIIYHDSIKHLGHNTIWCKHKSLKTLINCAIKHKLYHFDNPYNVFKWKYRQPIPKALTASELRKIEEVLIRKDISEHIKYYTKAFLLQCYTGLRYSDLKQLRFDHIQSNSIVLEQIKTDDIVYIPITNKAKQILNSLDKKQYVFRMNSNQKYNEVLKDIGMTAKIKTVLTSHIARHTFAVISIELGIPLEVISKILGHSDIKTTQIYAQIMNPVLDKWMENWNK